MTQISERVTLLIGSNLGNRKLKLEQAKIKLEKLCGKIVLMSKIYESKSHGFTAPDFYNQALVLETNNEPEKVLVQTQYIEKLLGRKHKSISGDYTSRTIDIDILFYGNHIIFTKNLEIPHPKIEFRQFVLVPLMEIMPDFQHPILKKKIREL